MNTRNAGTRWLWMLPVMALAAGSAGAAFAADKKMVERGRYLATVAGCNDCHTAGYLQGNGDVPEEARLTGSAVGFQGPWGTTYPSNLRRVAQAMTEAQWVEQAHAPKRPPMPWFNLRQMSDGDLRALYAYLRHLGPAGEPAPAFVPPGEKVATPYFEFVPKNLPVQARAE